MEVNAGKYYRVVAKELVVQGLEANSDLTSTKSESDVHGSRIKDAYAVWSKQEGYTIRFNHTKSIPPRHIATSSTWIENHGIYVLEAKNSNKPGLLEARSQV